MGLCSVTVVTLACSLAVAVAQTTQCDLPLGMKVRGGQASRLIPDNAIRASSTYYGTSLQAKSARLDGNSGWCPQPVSPNTMYENIEVDLREIHTITAIDTQGRYAQGRGAEYADSFAFDYQIVGRSSWEVYRDVYNNTKFQGNDNPYRTKRIYFNPPIVTRKIRIYPMTSVFRTVCLRFELYGCPEMVNEVIINSPTEVESVQEASENCNIPLALDTNNPPSRSTRWCSTYGVYSEMKEWLQLDLGTLQRVTAIETKSNNYAESFFLHYQRVESGRWTQFSDKQGTSMFRGSSSGNTAVKNILDPAIVAKRLRIIPYDYYGRGVCLTVAVYGCDWSEAVLSYSMPQGHQFGCEDMGKPIMFHDHIYDGQEEAGHLSNGLGQLTDQIEGLSDITADSGYGKSGYEWVGWSNDTLAGSPAELVFEFDSVRSFRRVSFHVNNMVSKRVFAFRSATLHFSVGGTNYQDDVVEYFQPRDPSNEQARTISINILGRVGRFVKVKLHLDSTWLLLSEVEFESIPNYVDDVYIKHL